MKSSSRNSEPADAEIRRARPLLGTFVEIRATARDTSIAFRATQSAFAAIEQVQQLMSFHDPASELSQLNSVRAGQTVSLHPWTLTVLRRAQKLHVESNGLFDIAVGAPLVRGGWLPAVANSDTPSSSRDGGNTADLFFARDRCAGLRRPALLDLGGIAKGFAVDQAVAALQRGGATAGVVNAGGDLRAFGPAAETVHVRRPESPGETEPLVALRNAALATSAHYFAERNVDGRACAPIFDPETQSLRCDRLSVSVQASECWLADALCKIVWLAGPAAAALLRKHHARAWVREAATTTTLFSHAA